MKASNRKGTSSAIPNMEAAAVKGSVNGSSTAGMKNVDSAFHVTGRSIYLDDIPVEQGTLYALPFDAPSAHAHVKKLDISKASAVPGLVRILTYKDIPGENQIGSVIEDEPLLVENEIHFWGMPMALIVAISEDAARQARKLINVKLEELPVITDPREAREKGELIIPPRRFRMGDTNKAWDACAHVFEGRADTNGQEHLYIETQGAYARITEHGCLRVSSSTQGPNAVQIAVARVLGIPRRTFYRRLRAYDIQ